MLFRPLYFTKALNFAWAAVSDIFSKLFTDFCSVVIAIIRIFFDGGQNIVAVDPNEQYLSELEEQLGKRLPVPVAELDQFIFKEIQRFLQEIPDQAEKAKFKITWDQVRNRDTDPHDELKTSAESQRRILRTLAVLENKWPRARQGGEHAREICFVTSRAFEGTDFTFNRSDHLSYGRCMVTSHVRRFPNPLNFLPYLNVRQLIQVSCQITSAVTTKPGNNDVIRAGDLDRAKWLNDRNFTKLVLFIHGYNQSFKQAVECCYKLRAKLHLDDENIRFAVFSWPCKGDTGFLPSKNGFLQDLTKIGMPWYYMGDLAANEGSEAFIPRFIDDLASKAPDLDEIHIIGHSMGCRLLLRALTDINPESVALIRSVTFASPDADRQMFETVLPTTLNTFHGKQANLQVPECTFVLLVNDCDLALGISSTLHGYPRAGRVEGRYPAVTQVPLSLFVVDSSTSDNWDEPRYMDDYAALRHFDFVNMNKVVEVIARTIMLDRPQLTLYLEQNFTVTGRAYVI